MRINLYYLSSSWFSIYYEIANDVYETVTVPIKKNILESLAWISLKKGIERQLQVTPFSYAGFEKNKEYTQKHRQSVLTNLGAESEFATLDKMLGNFTDYFW